MDNISELAHVIQGEAGLCPLTAMLAVAWIYSRNDTMYGYAKPSGGARLIAKFWESIPDPVPNKHFIFSRQDLRQARVRRLIRNKEPTVFECLGGLKLYAY